MGTPIRTRAVCKATWSSERFFPFDMDLGSEAVAAEVDSSFYHLWGAKLQQNNKGSSGYLEVREILKSGRHIVEGGNPRSQAVIELFENLIDSL